MEFFKKLFTADFMPHGHCYFWQPEVLWLNVISDGLIALSYFTIPIGLVYLVRKRQLQKQDLSFGGMFYMFGAFILFCGMTHVVDIISVWKPYYRFEGVMKAMTATVSLMTAGALIPLIPQALAIPSRIELEEKNAKLTESQSRFRGAFEYSTIGIAIVGLEGKWLEVNSALCRIVGYEEKELLAKTFQDITHPEDLNADLELLQETLDGKRDGYQMEKRYFHKEGQEVWVRLAVSLVRDEKGDPLYFVSQIEDITELRKAEAESERQREVLRAVLENLAEGVVVCDAQGELTLFNKTARDWHGTDILTVPQEQWAESFDLFEADGKTRLQPDSIPLVRAFKGERVRDAEIAIAAKDHPLRVVVTNGDAVCAENGEQLGAVAVMHDVTERKRRAEELEELVEARTRDLEQLKQRLPSNTFLPVIVLTADSNREARERALSLGAHDFLTKPFEHTEVLLRLGNHLRARWMHQQIKHQNEALDSKVRERTKKLREAQDTLIRQERLKAMGQMASGVAHDFNNAVAIIMGYSDMLLQFPELMNDAVELQTSIETINIAAKDAASIVKRLREFYRPDNEDEQIEDAAELCDAAEKAISLTQPRWKNQARAEGRNIKIKTDLDPVRVKMDSSKVREILTNLIFNAVDAMPEGGVIEITSRGESSVGVLRVKDTGAGMTEEVRRRCLEPFFSTKGDKGTGLGLGSVNALVQRHRGKVEIESVEGEGTAFTITLPREREEKSGHQSESDRLDISLHALVVDDEEHIREAMRRQMTHDGHTCVLARDGLEALAKYHAQNFDVVITDRSMPNVNGDHLATAIHRLNPDQPVIMLTGFGDIMKANNEKPVGVDVLLSKPLRVEQLREALFGLIGKTDPADVA